MPPNTLKVDRSTRYGNPYAVGLYEAHEAVRMFESYAAQRLIQEPWWLDPLRGKNLACWCAKEPCHADVLLRLANH